MDIFLEAIPKQRSSLSAILADVKNDEVTEYW